MHWLTVPGHRVEQWFTGFMTVLSVWSIILKGGRSSSYFVRLGRLGNWKLCGFGTFLFESHIWMVSSLFIDSLRNYPVDYKRGEGQFYKIGKGAMQALFLHRWNSPCCRDFPFWWTEKSVVHLLIFPVFHGALVWRTVSDWDMYNLCYVLPGFWFNIAFSVWVYMPVITAIKESFIWTFLFPITSLLCLEEAFCGSTYSSENWDIAVSGEVPVQTVH